MIQIHGQYDLADYKKAVKLNMRRGQFATWSIYLLLGLIGLMVLGGLLFTLFADSPFILPVPALLTALLFPALLGLMWFVLLPRQLSHVFKQQKDLSAPFDMTLSDTEFLLQNDFGTSRMPWNAFTKWKEDGELFLLYRSDAVFQMLPERLLRSQDEIQYVRTRLQANGVPPANQVRNALRTTMWVSFGVLLALVFVVQFVMQLLQR